MTFRSEALRPVSLVLLIDLADSVVEQAVRQVVSLHRTTSGFEPVFVTTATEPWLIVDLGYPFEHVVSYDEWVMTQDPALWARYLEERLQSIAEVYDAGNIVILGDFLSKQGTDRNLYGCLLRLSVPRRAEAELRSELSSIVEEVGFANINMVLLERKVDRIARAIRGNESRGRRLARRVRGVIKRRSKATGAP